MPRLLATLLLLTFGLGLGSCGQIAEAGEPTHRYVLGIDPELMREGEPRDPDAMAALAVPVISERLEMLGVTVHGVEANAQGQIVLAVSGEGNRDIVAAMIGRSAKLEFLIVDSDAEPWEIDEGKARKGSRILPMAEGHAGIAVRNAGGMSGERVTRAVVASDQLTGEPAILVDLDRKGAEAFAKLTAANVGRQFAIVIDDTVISAPYVNEPILGGRMQIAGGFTRESAREFAAMLSSGALPTPFYFVEERALD